MGASLAQHEAGAAIMADHIARLPVPPMLPVPTRYLAALEAALTRGSAQGWRAAPGGLHWLLVGAAVATLGGALLYALGGHQTGFLTINQAAQVLPAGLWQSVTMLGDERVVGALALLFARRQPRLFWTLLCAALLAALYSRGLKPLLDIPRPPALLSAEAFTLIGPVRRWHSFPSGHSVTAAVFWGVLLWFRGGLPWRALCTAMALAVGLSRVALGVHWPVDVAAGLAGGALAVPLGAWLAARLRGAMTAPRLHLALVLVAAVLAVSLLFDDGGYLAAAGLLRLTGGLVLAVAAVDYLLLPALWLRRAGRGSTEAPGATG